MSETDSVEGDASKVAVCQTLHVARAAPAKIFQRFRLRPRLIIQIQWVSERSHIDPVLEFWHPSLLGAKIPKNILLKSKLRKTDICVYHNVPRNPIEMESAHEDEIMAVIQPQKTTSREQENIIIHFRERSLGKAYSSGDDQYQCTWEDSNGQNLKVISYIPSGVSDGHGTCLQILSCNGEQIAVIYVDGNRISLNNSLEYPSSRQIFQSTTQVEVCLTFAAWIAMVKKRKANLS